ncbi:MAG: rhomboid family intramembrane serine protease [Phyllobacteriaceae bacterium]|nr:rhomboid family intramembrane serine protease [Phyllobacteriaceae bacterium]MBA89507.1 rhomboid family intramembrane serine protease [Phyllobacteriaceae bacterium]MBA90608.1 rhomboid family intramembrane serine protease [Phyllobacteriaceae bacterium]
MQHPAPEENGPPPVREPVFNIAGPALVMIVLCVAVHVMRVYVLTPDQDYALILRTAFVPLRHTGGFDLDVYAFLSPLTYSLLHGGWLHLVINMVWLAAFGSPLAARIGWLRFLAFWAVTALGAVALHFALFPDDAVPLVGASGAISGMMAAAARYGFAVGRTGGVRAFEGPLLSPRQMLASRLVLSFLGIWFVANLITGLASPGGSPIAWQAHIGGFIAGFVAIPWLDPRRRA